MRKLRKVSDERYKWFGGVCAGIGYATGIPAWIVRIAFVLAVLIYGFGILPYLLLWVFLPAWQKDQPADYDEVAAG